MEVSSLFTGVAGGTEVAVRFADKGRLYIFLVDDWLNEWIVLYQEDNDEIKR